MDADPKAMLASALDRFAQTDQPPGYPPNEEAHD